MVAERRAVLAHTRAPIRLAPGATRVPSSEAQQTVAAILGRGEVYRAGAEFRGRSLLAVRQAAGDSAGDAVKGAVEEP